MPFHEGETGEATDNLHVEAVNRVDEAKHETFNAVRDTLREEHERWCEQESLNDRIEDECIQSEQPLYFGLSLVSFQGYRDDPQTYHVENNGPERQLPRRSVYEDRVVKHEPDCRAEVSNRHHGALKQRRYVVLLLVAVGDVEFIVRVDKSNEKDEQDCFSDTP